MIIKELITNLRFKLDESGVKQYAQRLNDVKRQVKGAAVEHQQLDRAVERTSQSYMRLGNIMRTVFAGITLGAITKAADEVAAAKAQIGLYADGDKNAIAEQIYSNSQASASSWTAGMKMFGSIARNKAALGMTDQQAVQLSDVVSKAIGMTSQGAMQDEAAILQFGQALGSGTLQGDELRSILENSGGLAKAIADAFGVGVHELKDMGAEGKLTSKALAEGLLKQTEKVNQQYEKMPKTFGKGMTTMQNALKRMVAEWNENTGAAEKFYQMSQFVAENLETIIAIIVGGAIAYYIQGWVTALNLFIGRLWAARMLIWATMKSTLAWAAIFYGLYLIGQDFFVWLQGGNSVLGELIGKSSEWADEIQWVKETFASIVGWLRDGGAKLVAWAAAGAAVLSVLFTIWRAVVFVWSIFKYIRIAMFAVAAAGGPITLVLALIAAAAYLIYTHWDEIKTTVIECWRGAQWQWSVFKEDLMAGIAKLMALWQDFKQRAIDIWNGALAAWNAFKSNVITGIEAIKSNWMQLASLLANPITGSVKMAYDGMTGGYGGKVIGGGRGSSNNTSNTVNNHFAPMSSAQQGATAARAASPFLNPRVEVRK